ncbi:Wax ester synthase-like Acyl-CoA acyltransferase domain-containing protein [Nocardia amikacinitolerans]|uniref:wax ester/triacylglycerol synthase domain-containing protein n=1 Tax=Nocardia amikacinitolerans TaxID=756689 RepID=UPI000AB18798|nr:Wax ester synthase-like Acyl-CoA acyltransferase domain-containing protein [Nocardia amikacinitolerans]MCP2320210.1 Wax ester synthase-like Acyl-CoA acyltransferase domain-containing protein [Nocardia amikacinitolerans]
MTATSATDVQPRFRRHRSRLLGGFSGLPDGRLAIYTETHHALLDGVSAIQLM